MKKIIMAMLLSAFVAAPAVAADAPFYAGVKLGSASNSITSETSSGFGVFGGYTFNPYLAVEGGYTSLGSVGSGLISLNALEISAVGSFPINEQFFLFGKLGMASTTESGLGLSATRAAATFGFGGQYNISPTTGIRFGWDQYRFGDDIIFVKGDSSVISVGAVLKF